MPPTTWQCQAFVWTTFKTNMQRQLSFRDPWYIIVTYKAQIFVWNKSHLKVVLITVKKGNGKETINSLNVQLITFYSTTIRNTTLISQWNTNASKHKDNLDSSKSNSWSKCILFKNYTISRAWGCKVGQDTMYVLQSI